MAVTAMAGWHLYMVSCGETSVESQDHEQYRKFAGHRGEVSWDPFFPPRPLGSSQGQTFINSYDLGRWKNLQLFFNVGQGG